MDVSTDGFSKLLLKSSLLLCTYFTWLLHGTRKPPREVTCSQQGGDQHLLGSIPIAVGQDSMVGLLVGSLGGCELPAPSAGAPSGAPGVAHRAVLAPVLWAGDANTKGVLAGDHIAELQVVGKSWAFGNSTTACWCLFPCSCSEGALTHCLIHQTSSKCHCGNNSNDPGRRGPSYGVAKGRDGIREADHVKIQLVPFQRNLPSSVS